jgi:hypothetical protein
LSLTWKAKLAVIVGIIALISGLLLVIKYQRDVIAKQTAIQNSLVDMKKIQGDITRNQVQYATPADLDKFAESLNLKLGPIQDDLKTLKANITAIQTITVNSNGENKTNIASTTTSPRTDPIPANEPVDPYGYQKNKQTLALTQPYGKTNVPLGSVDFSAWQQNPWQLSLYPEKYSVVDVIGTDEDGKSYAYSKFSITSNGKTYDIDIDDAKMVEELPQSKFSWWNPKLYISIGDGVGVSNAKNNVFAGLYFSPFSYGPTKLKPNFIFLQFGPNTNGSSLGLMVSPFQWNIGEYLKIINNTYIGPDLFWINNGFYLGGSLSVSL